MTYRSGSTFYGSGTTSAVVNKPTGVVADDVMLAVVSGFQTATAVTAPSGWTLLRDDEYTIGLFTSRQHIYWKTAGGAEPATYTWGFASPSDASIGVVAYSLIDPTAPIDTSAATIDGSYGTSIVFPSVTPTAVDATVVYLSALTHQSTLVTVVAPSGTSQRLAANNSTYTVLAADQQLTTITATGAKTATADGNMAGVAVTVALMHLNRPPNAPTLVSPVASVTVDRALPIGLSWTFSDPDTGDAQTKYDLRYKLVGAGSWTTVTATSAVPAHEIAAATLAAGNYEWQVRTYDTDNEVGPYSTSGFFRAVVAPAAPVITAPADGATIILASGSVTWTAPSQTAYQVRKLGDSGGTPDTSDVLYDSGRVPSVAGRTAALTYPVNNRDEHIQVRIEYDNLWSPWDSHQVTIDYEEPATATVVVTGDDPVGAINVDATHPAPAGAQPTVSSMDVYRREVGDTDDGIRVGAALAPTDEFTDWAVASGVAYEYRIKANGSNGTSSYSAWTG